MSLFDRGIPSQRGTETLMKLPSRNRRVKVCHPPTPVYWPVPIRVRSLVTIHIHEINGTHAFKVRMDNAFGMKIDETRSYSGNLVELINTGPIHICVGYTMLHISMASSGRSCMYFVRVPFFIHSETRLGLEGPSRKNPRRGSMLGCSSLDQRRTSRSKA